MYGKSKVTVFLAMILFSVCSLLCVVVESARTAGARRYLRTAVDPPTDSLIAQYHRELWDKYRMLDLEYDKAETLEKELKELMGPYMEVGNWYPMKVDRIWITDMTGLTQGDGRYFEQEISDYMKYGLLGVDWDELDEAGAIELSGAQKEGNGVNRVSKLYPVHSREAVRVEKALETTSSILLAQRERWEQGEDCLDRLDGGGFVSQTSKVIRELERFSGQVETYEKRADKLYKRLTDSRERFLEETKDLSDDVRAVLEEEISQYESHAAQGEQHRREVGALTNLSRDRTRRIGETINMAEETTECVSNWKPEDEDGELDEAALWQLVREHWSQYSMLSLGVKFGVHDKEKEGFLEQVANMAGKGVLELVLPEGIVVSGTDIRLSGTSPVQRRTDGGGGSKSTDFLTGARALIQRLIIGEYDIRFFKGLKKEIQKGEFYELEYIIHGKGKDKGNLSGVVVRSVAFREGFNLAHILSDSEERQEARSLALTIVGGTGILPLVSVVTFFIMAMWALGEAPPDARCLLEGRRVPVIKTASDQKMDLVGFLEMGRSGRLIDGERGDGNGSGTDYKGYLRVLIFGGYDTDLVYRMMDIIQVVIARKQPGFSLANCACTVNAEAPVSGKYAFSSNGLWKSQEREKGYAYDTRMVVAGGHLEDYKSPQTPQK